MNIIRSTAIKGKIHVSFDEEDFHRKTEDGKMSWIEAKECLKEMIAWTQREWDAENKIWIVNDTPENLAHLQAIKARYFKDQNQLELL